MGWQNIGTRMKCFTKVGKLQWETGKSKGRKRGQGTRKHWWWARREAMLWDVWCWECKLYSDSEFNEWSENVPKPTSLHEKKKPLWWTAQQWHNSRFWPFIPIGLLQTLLKNLLPFHLSRKMTCFAALLEQIILRAMIPPFTWKIFCCLGYWQNKTQHDFLVNKTCKA